jgi:hypothetical protein
MDKTAAQIDRGHRAQNILSDPLFVEAQKHIEDELYRLFCETKPTDTATLVEIKSMQYMHTKYMAFLKSAVTDGKLARIALESQKRPNVLDRFINR